MSILAATPDGSRLSADTFDPVPTLDGPLVSLGELVLLSLFSWGRAAPDDVLPVPGDSRRGWWGDSTREDGDVFGSKLWLLSRRVLTAATLVEAEDLVEEALAWMVTDGLVSRVEAGVEAAVRGRLELTVRIYRSVGADPVELSFPDLWGDLRG